MQYKDFDKQLIQLHKEEKVLHEQRRNLGWEPLIPPIQKGWKRFFVLRDDVARSKNAEFFQVILDKINTYDWSYRRDFIVRKRKFGKKSYAVKEQKLLAPDEWHFAKLGFSEREKQMFHEVFRYENRHKKFAKRFVFNEPWRFVIRVRPNIITKVRKRDEVIEARIREIDNYMERNSYEGRLGKLLHGTYKWKEWRWKGYGKYDEVNPFANKSLHQILDLIKE